VILRFLLVSSGVLFLGSIGAFFLLASLLSIATVAFLLLGLVLMFWIGVHVGARPIRSPEDAESHARLLETIVTET
jgi:hypothetical protein